MEDYLDGKLDSIRNPDGWWINTSVFREEANHFRKYQYYVADPWGSPRWKEYWSEQKKRCMKGYSVGGVKITGDHYFYLNFCPIMKVEDTSKTKSKKIKDFPDFWDGDYNYFWIREIARDGILDATTEDGEYKTKVIELDSQLQAIELKKLFEGLQLEVKIKVDYLRGGWNLIVGKSRRKGYSYKNSSVAAKNYFTKPHSLTIFNAYDKKYLFPKGIFTMAYNTVNFINENTGWAMPNDVGNRPAQGYLKASYIEYKNGIQLEKGFMSELLASTCKDNADANRGKDAEDIIVEEAGAFGTPGLLKDLYKASEDCVKAGAIQTGLITIFGTSGDMEGGTADYADMHSRPEAFGLLPFNNIWDKDSEKHTCGFFHPINWNMEGFYDEQGNSDKDSAKTLELDTRANLIKNGATSVEIQRRMQEKPLGPSEAFASVSVNNFPVVELKNQLQIVKGLDLQRIKGTPVELYYEGLSVVARPILNGTANPVSSYLNVPTDKRGCVVIYEPPVVDAPKGLYKIGYDPVRQDEGSSLAGIIVYKGSHLGSSYKNTIVAEYIGRMETPEDMDKIAEMLAIHYNTTIMHENEVTGVKNYFRRNKILHLLAHQPDAVISKNVKNSKVRRIYGCHMIPQLKDAGERYVKEWLTEIIDYNEDDTPIRAYDRIYSVRLLEELISYNRKGNFDLVSSLFMCMFQVQEEPLNKVHDENSENKKVEKLLEMMNYMHKN